MTDEERQRIMMALMKRGGDPIAKYAGLQSAVFDFAEVVAKQPSPAESLFGLVAALGALLEQISHTLPLPPSLVELKKSVEEAAPILFASVMAVLDKVDVSKN